MYLIVVLTGIFSLAYVPSKLISVNNPAATFQNIKNAELLFRFGILSSLICYTFFLLLPLALYRLLKPVHENFAKLMVLFAVVSVPISFLNVQHKFAILSLISSQSYLDVFTIEQLQSNVLFQLNQYGNGIHILSIFWGLWLLPLGLLIYRSGFLPKILGILLIGGCMGYLINFLGYLLIQGYTKTGIPSFIRLPATLGEIGTCLWLLIMGAKNKVEDGTISKKYQ